MNECASFSFSFTTREEAQSAAHIIKNWAEKELTESLWTNQLFPVESNVLFVGDNAAVTWCDYDGKINRLADIVHSAMPDVSFSGEQSYSNLVTGFETAEDFVCDGNTVTYKAVINCSFCGESIQDEDYYEFDDMLFCNENCAKSHIIERLLSEDDFDEDELEEKEIDELIETLEDYE